MLGDKLGEGNFYFRFWQSFELEGLSYVHKGKETLDDWFGVILYYDR